MQPDTGPFCAAAFAAVFWEVRTMKILVENIFENTIYKSVRW